MTKFICSYTDGFSPAFPLFLAMPFDDEMHPVPINTGSNARTAQAPFFAP
jgi:hypothetical protein